MSSATEDLVTRDQLLERARQLFPLFRGGARQADEARHLPSEFIDAFTDAGFVRLQVPRRWGGYEADFNTCVDVVIEIGRAYGSMAWVGSFYIDHPFFPAQFEEQAQEDVWGSPPGPDSRISTSFVPVGRVTEADGGWPLTGDWAWASGAAHAHWVMVGGMVPNPDPSESHPQYRLFLVPTSDVKVVDTWYSAGLRGSGRTTW